MFHQNKLSACIAILFWAGLLIIWLSNDKTSPQPAFAGTRPNEKAIPYQQISDYLQTSAENAHIPSLSVTIVDKDNVLFSQGYGNCKSCDTPFLLGSVSKSFTAVCIMQLSEQGKLDLNAKIAAYLPNAADGDKITVRQLLNHTSGLGEHQTLSDFKIINKQGVHSYANVNYSLLGEIIEAISSEPYEDYLSKHVLQPLNLSHTATTYTKSIRNGLIDGYTNYWGLPVRSRHKYPVDKNAWITVPAGYISSSTNDLGSYLQMYLDGGKGILSKQGIDTMFYGDTVFIDGDIPYWYGYGWATIKKPLSEPVLRHSGLIETGTSCVFILPKKQIAVAVASNVNDYFVTNEMMDRLGWGVVLMLLGDKPNEITKNEYFFSHIRINLLMFAVLAVSLFSLCLLPKYASCIKQDTKRRTAAFAICMDVLLAVFILLLIPIVFATPLWVAKSFVPDVFLTVLAASLLLFASGLIKGIFYFYSKALTRFL